MKTADFFKIFHQTGYEMAREKGEDFGVDKYNHRSIEFFCAYMANDISRLEKLGGRNNKGILFYGPNGTGKSHLFRILERIYLKYKNPQWRIRIAQTLIIPDQYKRFLSKPVLGINDLDPIQYWSLGPILFDDFGAERKVRHFGDEFEIMDDLIQRRYDRFVKNHQKTFVTTNLSLKEIEGRYNPRTTDRIYEMFNIVPLVGPTRRK